MNNTSVNVQSSYPTKHVFSKGTAVAMSVTLFILAAVLLGRSICAMIYSQRLSVCQSLYQIFGTGSVPIVNIVVGVVTACLLVFLAIGLFSARSGANSNPPMTAGLSFLKIGLIISIVYTSLAVITSFASVSIVNMNPEGYIGFINVSATGQFILTLFFGIAMICGEAAMLRLCSAMTTNLQSGAIVKKGAGMAFLAGVVGVVTGAVAFFIKLFRLVAPPKDYLQNIAADKSVDGITSADMLLNAFNVLIFAAVAVIFVLLIVMAGSYAIRCDDVIRAARNGGYNISRQTISKYISLYERKELIATNGDTIYYRVYHENGIQKHEVITKEKYCAAWRIYWNYRREGEDSGFAFACMYAFLHGVPRKQKTIVKNAFYLDTLNTLSNLVAESFLYEKIS